MEMEEDEEENDNFEPSFFAALEAEHKDRREEKKEEK